MSTSAHFVIIGNGITGSRAADVLRKRDPQARITLVTGDATLFYNRFDLPDVFEGKHDWVDYLVNPPAYYEDNHINVRRKTLVTEVDTHNHRLMLSHREPLSYDSLLIATGGANNIPVRLLDMIPLMHPFNNIRSAMNLYKALPSGGTAIMLGGDVVGLDLARRLTKHGYRVILVAGERTCWPHEVDPQQWPQYRAGLEKLGLEVIDNVQAVKIEAGRKPAARRTVTLSDGTKVQGDVVLPFYGLAPSVDFVSQAGIDIERGILVDTHLKTTHDNIWAAGDACQIWSQEHNDYRFYHGWKNVKAMGETAACNMTGEVIAFSSVVDESLHLRSNGTLHSPYWEHD
jgi:NAD(P)H-nitrite reductase large subunit